MSVIRGSEIIRKGGTMSETEDAQKIHWKRNIILFLSSQTLSLFGSALVQYAIMWHITLTTQSGIMMTLYIICGFIPTFLLSPFAGVWADRFNRKTLIMIADSMIAVVTLMLAITFMLGYQAVWLLFIISAVRALGAGIQTPAVGAILPQIVPQDKLTKVNGINGSLQALIMFVAPIVSAGLLTVATIEAIFLSTSLRLRSRSLHCLSFSKFRCTKRRRTPKKRVIWTTSKRAWSTLNSMLFSSRFLSSSPFSSCLWRLLPF